MPAPANSVSVFNGSDVVEGNLTLFTATEDDQFILNGLTALIKNRVSNTQILLQKPWPGASLTGQTNWTIAYVGPYWNKARTLAKQITDALIRIDGGLPIAIDAVGTFAERANYNNQLKGFKFLAAEPLPYTLYVKSSDANSSTAWYAGQVIKPSTAQTTLEAEEARDAAQGFAIAASGYSATVTAAAATATNQASIATSAAVTATGARDVTTAARDVTTAARDTTIAARDVVLGAKTDVLAIQIALTTARDVTFVARDATLGYRDTTLLARDTTLTARDTTVQAKADTLVARDAAQSATTNALALFSSLSDVQAARDIAVSSKNTAVTAKADTLGFRNAAEQFRNEAQIAASSAAAASGIPVITSEKRLYPMKVKPDASGLEYSRRGRLIELASMRRR